MNIMVMLGFSGGTEGFFEYTVGYMGGGFWILLILGWLYRIDLFYYYDAKEIEKNSEIISNN